MGEENSTTLKPRRRWFQVSLRTFFLFTLLSGVACSSVVKFVLVPGYEQKLACDWVRQHGGRVIYENEILVPGCWGPSMVIDREGYPEDKSFLGSCKKWLGKDYEYDVTEIYIYSEDITDIKPLAGLKGLKTLSITLDHDVDLSILDSLTGLEKLYLHGTKSIVLPPLEKLQKLRILSIYNPEVSDLSGLKGLNNLKELYLESTQVSDLSPLRKLHSLEGLYLESTKIKDLKQLSELKSLIHLGVNDTEISNLNGLEGLQNLESLSINGTKVTNLTPISHLDKLQCLLISDTKVTDLSPLYDLKNLGDLYCAKLDIGEDQLNQLRRSIPRCEIDQKAEYDEF